MTLPAATDTYFQERRGVIAVSNLVNELKLIWRETPNADVGIDGQIEHVDDEGKCTGKLLALQVKSGPSYFQNEDEDCYRYYPSSKHINYWRDFPIPVILVLYDTRSKIAFWADARQQLKNLFAAGVAIKVPKSQVLDSHSRNTIFGTAGSLVSKVLSVPEAVKALAALQCTESQFQVGALDLFGLGMINIGRQLFFSMDLCMEIAECRSSTGVAVNTQVHDFIQSYVEFLISQNLAHFDYSDYLIERDVYQMVPIIVATYTERGREAIKIINSFKKQDERLLYEGHLVFESRFLFNLSDRLERLLQIQGEILSGD